MAVTEGGHFVVKDATGFSICYVYARKDEALRGSYMTPAEAVVIAEAIARLPDLAAAKEPAISDRASLSRGRENSNN